MAGGSKKEQRRARKAEKKAAKTNNVITEEQHYQQMNEQMNEIPIMGRAVDGIIRNLNRLTVQKWSHRFGPLPSLLSKNLFWLQLLTVDVQKTAQIKLYALGSRVGLSEDDSDIVERSRKMFQDAAPAFLSDDDLWILSRSLVKKGYNGLIDDTLDFASYDPLECLLKFPLDSSSGIRCAEIFLFFAVDGDVPGDDLSSREEVMEFLTGLNSEDGTNKIHAFAVVAGSVVAIKEKLDELKGSHITA